MFGTKLTIAFAVIALSHGLAQAQQRDGATPYHDTHQGMVQKLSVIEASIIPNMKRRGCTYIGAEYYADSLRYRLKFMHDGSVIWIDVDGRNGKIIGEAGH